MDYTVHGVAKSQTRLSYFDFSLFLWHFPGGNSGKEPDYKCRGFKGRGVQSLGWEDPLEEGMTTHSSILAWRIPQTEEPRGLQLIGSQRVGRD